jgi:hypothetical protein
MPGLVAGDRIRRVIEPRRAEWALVRGAGEFMLQFTPTGKTT